MTRAVLVLTLAVLAGGCVTASGVLDPTNSAELTFAKASSPGGLRGSFDSLDGRRFEGSPLTIRVPEGTHVVEYSCPDVLSMDFQASIEASVIAGHRYLLYCSANEPGAVRER